MATEIERLSRLIGDIYDAALDPSRWYETLHNLAGFVGGSGSTLYFTNTLRLTGASQYDWGIDPSFKQSYFDTYIKFDPTTPARFLFDVEQVYSTVDIVPYDEFLETRFYKEWGKPQNMIDMIQATLDKTATSFSACGVILSEKEGPADGETYRRMRLVVPHIRRAALIGNAIDLRKSEAAQFADTLDGLSAGMFLVDETGRIVHANASGQAMLLEGSLLRSPEGRLTTNESNIERGLYEVFAAAAGGDEAVGTRGIAVPLLARDGERYVAHVLPLTSGARRRAGAAYSAVAAVFVHKAALDTPSPPEIIAKTFKLTPAELRVLLAIVNIGGVPEVAAALGVADTTVKTHLGRLFEKTGTGRQADLVKLVAEFSNPLLN
jgi:DNA-binding CsgD family transcriptional regulator